MNTLRRLGAAVTVAAAAWACGGGDAQPQGPRVHELHLMSPPVAVGETTPFEGSHPLLTRLVEEFRSAARVDQVRGMFLRVGPMGGAWGRVGDLVEVAGEVREANKPIHCHFDSADNVAFVLLSSVCDRISMSPAGMLDLVGVSAHVFYARALMDRIGLQADLFEVGRYKGAADVLTEREMPPETQQAVDAILDDLQGALRASIARRPKISASTAQDVVDEGPFDAMGAMSRGLIDAIAFDDEARERARKAGGAERVIKRELTPEREELGFLDLVDVLTGHEEEEEVEGARIVLVVAEGPIVDSEAPSGLGDVRSGPYVRKLRALADDDEVKAVVVRLDSPGGSALASDRIWHALRRVARRKPVIASVGDMAASGGYYIASAATEIFAHEASLVGSIGVVGGKISAGELAERVGVRSYVLQRGKRAGWSSPVRPLNPEERSRLRHVLDSTYRRFIRRVMVGRDLDRDQVYAAAEGLLMSGREGLQRQLVDRSGGLSAALSRARELGRLRDDVPIVTWPRPKNLVETLKALVGQRRGLTEGAVSRLWEEFSDEGTVRSARAWTAFFLRDERITATVPYALELR